MVFALGSVLTCLAVGWACHAALADSPPRLYVVNALSQDISIIDMATDTVTGRIPLGIRGFHMAVTANGLSALVTAVPAAIPPTQQKAVFPQVLAIDLAHQRVAGVISADISPLASVHLHPNERQAFVVTAARPGNRNTERGRVLFLDLQQRKVVRTTHIGLNPLDSVMTADGRTLYTADWASRAISVVDLSSGALRDVIPLGLNPVRTLALRPDGKKLYAALDGIAQNAPAAAMNSNANAAVANNATNFSQQQALVVDNNLLCEYDTTSGTTVRYSLGNLNPIYALALSPDGRYLYAYGRVMSSEAQATPRRSPTQATSPAQQAETYDVIIFDLRQKQVVQHLGNFGYIATMTLSPDGKKLYLIGTPGDPATEAAVRSKSSAQTQRLQNSVIANARNGSQTDGGWNTSAQTTATQQDLNSLLTDLSLLPKTVTVLDVKSGKVVKSLTVGSLPQGYAVQAR